MRDVELILAARGVTVSYESIRDCGIRFGRQFAAPLKRRRPKLGDKWHLDEVFIQIRGKLHYLWRAVDPNGPVLDILVQKMRDTEAAKRFFQKLIKGRAKASHQPTRRRERQMQTIKSARQAQRFLSAHSRIHSHFQLRRHLLSAAEYRSLRATAFRGWQDVTRADTAA